uniref:Dephospho-CoA kinase domain-containing protein n=2 Tax=Macrostomum lignano TaxID=282301 RepID=A0A1I8GAZ8_9PLAT
YLVGLTGGIASGKSTVADQLRRMGVLVIDADSVAKSALEPRQPAWAQVVREFGPGVLLPDSDEIDRDRLGAIVFADAGKRAKLNAIVHPTVYREIAYQLIYHFFMLEQFVVLELPLLFEKSGAGMLPWLTEVVVVYCRPEQQLERLMKRNAQLTVEQAKQRIAAQLPLDSKVTKATVVIDNQHSEAHSRDQAVRLYKRLLASRAQWISRSLFTAGVAVLAAVVGLPFYLWSARLSRSAAL